MKIIFRIDDLPAPEGPDKTTHSPALTTKFTPRTTGSFTPPCRCMVKVFSAPEISIIADIGRLMAQASWRKDRGNEQLGVGFVGVVEHLVGQTGLDHLATLHHHHPVRQ